MSSGFFMTEVLHKQDIFVTTDMLPISYNPWMISVGFYSSCLNLYNEDLLKEVNELVYSIKPDFVSNRRVVVTVGWDLIDSKNNIMEYIKINICNAYIIGYTEEKLQAFSKFVNKLDSSDFKHNIIEMCRKYKDEDHKDIKNYIKSQEGPVFTRGSRIY